VISTRKVVNTLEGATVRKNVVISQFGSGNRSNWGSPGHVSIVGEWWRNAMHACDELLKHLLNFGGHLQQIVSCLNDSKNTDV
jgi:hypothetical protein